MIRVELPRFDRFDAWRDAARRLAGTGVAGEHILWADKGMPADLFEAEPIPTSGQRNILASKEFLSLAKTVGSHSDPQRWALLYDALVRFQSNRNVLANPADPLTVRLKAMEKSVRRDIHKMHAFVRFHEIDSSSPRRTFAAWFEPDHPILQVGTPFFARRFADMDWMIATPEGVAHFDGTLRFSEPQMRPDLPRDASHDLWQTYFANIFNPARVKIKAMKSEMPLKYWKNLPETRLISEMLADAPRRVRAMAEARMSNPPAFAAKVTASVRVPPPSNEPNSMKEAREHAASCTRCALCHHATQTVWGEGPPDAALMIIGEAPGDHEDLAGRPFVGPAGRLLRASLAEVGLTAERIWLSNAVKHFKFTPRGKRRLHQSPNGGEIAHCRWWLDLERRLLKPQLTVALGTSAAFALTGNHAPLSARRGRVEAAIDGGQVLITWHPSLVLRLRGAEKLEVLAQFNSDLQRAARLVKTE